MTPEDLVEIIVRGSAPSLREWEQAKSDVVSDRAGELTPLRADLQRERFRRWAAAIVLARLGADDGDDLALAVLEEMDWDLIPGPGFNFWQQAAWHLQDALTKGRRPPNVEALAISALGRADLKAPEWTDVVDEALGLLEWTADASAVAALARVASEHLDDVRRERAAAILADINHSS